jgi:hypothetical protein
MADHYWHVRRSGKQVGYGADIGAPAITTNLRRVTLCAGAEFQRPRRPSQVSRRPPNKEMKLTKPSKDGASQLISSVRPLV